VAAYFRSVMNNNVSNTVMWAGWSSRYSDWLQAGRSGDRIPVEAKFSASVQTGPGAQPPYLNWVPVLSRG